jgi:2-iminobutanoate/2-iminopropanoate deaminase
MNQSTVITSQQQEVNHIKQTQTIDKNIIKHIDTFGGAPRPYSQVVVVNGLSYLSGCLGNIPGTKLIMGKQEENFEREMKQAMDNLVSGLKASRSDISSLIKTTIYLTSMSNYEAANRIYLEYLNPNNDSYGSLPARTTIVVAELPFQASIEIEAVALANTLAE